MRFASEVGRLADVPVWRTDHTGERDGDDDGDDDDDNDNDDDHDDNDDDDDVGQKRIGVVNGK